ncbi:phosphoribosylformimino-5-aminoimidazole carboxamide ribotide isomerase [Roseburia hominis]
MKFRPCIDIHNGKVKQIVGGSLKDQGDQADTNYESRQGAAYYAKLYRRDHLTGGHIILLNPASSPYYEETRAQALAALSAYPGGLQIGGGITAEKAGEYLAAGASHVIVTSYVFQNGNINWEHLKRLTDAVGREHVVLDLSCRRKPDGEYYIVTDRWQKFTDVRVSEEVMETLAEYCDEFLIHGVDVEGRSAGAPEELVRLLAAHRIRKITYAGGIGSMEDLKRFEECSGGRLDFTIGSALDIFGGTISYAALVQRESECEQDKKSL